MHKTPVNKGRNEFLHFVSIEKLLNHVYIYQTVINILTIMFIIFGIFLYMTQCSSFKRLSVLTLSAMITGNRFEN